jgi:prophage tail gpP-like protein
MTTPVPDDVTITVNGSSLSGWTEARVTRRLDACPNDFEVSMTERFPGQIDSFVVQAGDPCTVSLGADLAITGYVDRFARGYDARSHTLTISGRGKCQDLVDCMAEWPTGQFSNMNALQIAQKLSAPYGITVSCLSNPGPNVPQINLTIGEKAFDLIERFCRFAALLAYEGPDGNLILATTQDTMAASGFVEGQNVQAAHVFSAMDQRYQQYWVFRLATDVLGDLGQGNNLIYQASDPNVLRHRRTALILEAGGGGEQITEARADWEAARRLARGFQVTLVADSWRDSAGALFAPNTQAPLSLPNLHLDNVTWTFGEVTYRRAEKSGTTLEATLMDPAAFNPEPILLLPQVQDFAPAPPSSAPAVSGGG